MGRNPLASRCRFSRSRSHLSEQSSPYKPVLHKLEEFVFKDISSPVIGTQILPEAGFFEAVPGLSCVKPVACIDGKQVSKGQGYVLFVAATGFLFCAFVEQIW